MKAILSIILVSFFVFSCQTTAAKIEESKMPTCVSVEDEAQLKANVEEVARRKIGLTHKHNKYLNFCEKHKIQECNSELSVKVAELYKEAMEGEDLHKIDEAERWRNFAVCLIKEIQSRCYSRYGF